MPEDIKGLRLLLDRIAQMEHDVRHADRALRVAGEIVVTSVKENFYKAGRPKKWSPLAPSTIRSRMRDSKGKSRGTRGRHRSAGGMRVMIDQADLVNSINKQVVADGVMVGTNVHPKALRRLHYGYPGGSGRGHAKTPARPFLLIQPEDITDIGNVFRRHIARKG